MKRRKRAGAFVALLLALVLPCVGMPVAAAQSDQPSGDVGFFVRPQLPQNQRDGNHGYFDLRMQPDKTQSLVVEVFNQSDRSITVEVRAITASSGRYGVIDYTTPDVKDESLEHAFCDMAEVEKDTLTIPALGSANAVVHLTMPHEAFDGVVLGGIVFTKSLLSPDASNSSNSTLGASIQNRYSYVVGVVLNETDVQVDPDFEIYTVQPELVNYSASPVHYIRNKNAAIVKGMSLSIEILREGERFMEVVENNLDMAPCSVMPLAPAVPEDRLPAGHYVSKTVLRLNGRVWKFENSFTITGAEAQQLNSALLEKSAGLPLWVILLIVGLALAVVVLTCTMFYQYSKKNRNNRKNLRKKP